MGKVKKNSGSGLFIFSFVWWLVKLILKAAGIFMKLALSIVTLPFTTIFHRKEPGNGEEYEKYICRQMKKYGYKKIQTTSRTGDHGVDILALAGRKTYAVQCKFYSANVGNYAVQEAYTGCAYYECDVPVVVTNMLFTKQAKQEAEKLGVELWEESRIPVRKNILVSIFGRNKKPVYEKYIDDSEDISDEVDDMEEIYECIEIDESEEMSSEESTGVTEFYNENSIACHDEFIEITDSDGNKTLVNRQSWLYGDKIE